MIFHVTERRNRNGHRSRNRNHHRFHKGDFEMGVGTIKQADRILEAYADLKGLKWWECAWILLSPKCGVLVKVLGKGSEGEVTAEERKELEVAGFAKGFVEKLAGSDGKEALQRRGRWFANRPVGFFDRLKDEYKRESVPLLIEALKDDDSQVRWRAAWGLAKIQDPQAVPALLETLKDDNGAVRLSTALALGEIKDPRAVPALIEVLKDSDDDVLWYTTFALSEIKDQAVPALIEALKDNNAQVRWHAVKALGRIKNPRAVPALLEALKDNNVNIRWTAVGALGEIGSAQGVRVVAPAIPKLEKMAEGDPNPATCQRAQEVVDKLRGMMR